MNKRINEVEIKDSELKPLDKNINKVSPSVCKIIINEFNGSGFFIKLNINNNILLCLMTNEHVIKKEMVENKENIEIKYDYESKGIKIKLDKTKRIIKDFIDIKIDAIIVEILPEDNIEENYFLEPELYNINDILNHPIYIPQYPLGNNFCYSSGFIKEINDIEITHNSSTKSGSSGSPIFLENSMKVIAIHKQGSLNKQENYGNFIYPIIQELQKNNNIHNNKNNIHNNNNKINHINNNIKKEEYSKYNYNDGKYYIGPVLNGLPNGKGKIYYKNNKLYYEGDLKMVLKKVMVKYFLKMVIIMKDNLLMIK